MSPDKPPVNDAAVNVIRSFFDQSKAVAAICHGPWMLVEANVMVGREVASWPSLETYLENAGAKWVGRGVVADNGLVAKMIEQFAEGQSARRRRRRGQV